MAQEKAEKEKEAAEEEKKAPRTRKVRRNL